MGGFLSGFTAANYAWKYDIENNSWSSAQPMHKGRAHHSCGVVKSTSKERSKVIVVGGSIEDGSNTTTVEIYDPEKNIWVTGPQLPIPIKYSQMVEDEVQGGVLLIGGRTSNSDGLIQRSSDIYHLSNTLKEWKKLGRRMELGRESHVAFMLPEDIERCQY